MSKDVFVDGHKRSNVVEDRKNFLKNEEELKPYVVDFKEDDTIKPKVYLFDCELGENNWQSIIVITNDGFTFSTNDGVEKVWTQKRDTFLRPKGWE